ncbi:MAG TPA: PEP-CTERM sorting domain-containing protein, partial [Chthoniobacteraceae bacterium]|nr:PEP-CTERM sorting domain-containing protein [Chthoniobacteraceae bacterium]
STPSWSASATLFRSETLYSFDLSSVLALNNDPSIFFRLVNTAATGATAGTNRVDDFTVSDGPVQLVPEPSSFVALLAGVGMLTIARRRRA